MTALAPSRETGRARGLRVIVVGGGASGVLAAVHLLRLEGIAQVTLIEERELLGCGIAYSTPDPAHLLNTRIGNMSAFPERPDDFLDWLRAGPEPQARRDGFVARATYGQYLASRLAPWRKSERLRCIRAACVRLDEPARGGVAAHLADGRVLLGDIAILAVGHAVPTSGADPLVSLPWSDPLPTDAPTGVLIVGSGLTMVDQVLSLLDRGYTAPIRVISRRGLLPQAHGAVVPSPLSPADLPAAQSAAGVMQWLRRRVRQHEAQGGDWRDVVDGLRPHVQELWRRMPLSARASFLRHACAHWEVHRHRLPPTSAARLEVAIASGRVRRDRAAFRAAWRDEGGQLHARIEHQPDGRVVDLAVDRIIDCRGIRRDPEEHAGPVVADLLATGRARLDPLRIGIEVEADCAVIGADGAPSPRVFAVGPVSRAAFWEITAIPDIRVQTDALARRLVGPVRSPRAAAAG